MEDPAVIKMVTLSRLDVEASSVPLNQPEHGLILISMPTRSMFRFLVLIGIAMCSIFVIGSLAMTCMVTSCWIRDSRPPLRNETLMLLTSLTHWDDEVTRANFLRYTCSLPKNSGVICDEMSTRFYFDSNEFKCVPFGYKGCGGNQNNFKTHGDCYNTCSYLLSVVGTSLWSERPPPPKTQDDCYLEAESGSCLANMPRYFYDQESGKCRKFTYGGCDGNANRFGSLEECQRLCAPDQLDEKSVLSATTQKPLITLQCNTGKFVSTESGRLACDQDEAENGERFELVRRGDKIAFKTANDRYCSREKFGRNMQCDRVLTLEWELFTRTNNTDGSVSFKCSNGNYLSSENGIGGMTCVRNHLDFWEKFIIH